MLRRKTGDGRQRERRQDHALHVSGRSFSRDFDDPSRAFTRTCERIRQPSQLFIALEQVDSGIPVASHRARTTRR